MKRTTALALALLVVMAAVPAPTVAGQDDSSEPVLDGRTQSFAGWLGFSTPSTAATGDDGVRWVVDVDEGSTEDLRTWAGQQDATVERVDETANTALIEASPDAVGVSKLDRLLGTGLTSEPFVQSVSLVETLSGPDPVSLKQREAVDAPLADRALVRGLFADGSYNRNGISYAETANVTTLKEAREMTAATDVAATGQGRTVAVIDSGVDTANGRLFGEDGLNGSDPRILPESKNMLTNETVREGGLDVVQDKMGHGTHVASTIAADTANDSYDGYAPDANVLALKVFNQTEPTSTADIAQAIRYAADQDVDVIHMSLGTPIYIRELEDAVQYALARGSVVVTSSGNSRDSTRWLSSPSDVPEPGVIAVAAANSSPAGPKDAGVAYFSSLGNDPGTADFSLGASQGQNVSVSAVGMQLEAVVVTEDDELVRRRMSGTSMAAPAVSGSILLALEEHPQWRDDPAFVQQKVERSASAVPGAAFAETGHGYLNTSNLVHDRAGGDQLAARTQAARDREQFYRWLHNAAGGVLPLDEDSGF